MIITDLKKTNRQIVALGLLVFLCMFFLTALTPKYADDFAYSFSFVTDQRITSFFQIFPSMSIHRELLNGRVVPHFLVQLFLMLPKVVFSILNAFNVGLLLWLSNKFMNAESVRQRTCSLAAGVFAIWVFSPSFGENYLWLDGAVNYSWGISVLLIFLWPYGAAWLKTDKETPKLWKVLHVLLALFAGAWSENGSLVFMFLAFSLMMLIWKRDKRIRYDLLLSLIMSCAGYAFLMSAPATSGRSAGASFERLALNFRRILLATQKYLIWLYLAAAVLLALCLLWHGRRERIVFSVLLLAGGLASLGCFVFAAYFVERHFSVTVFLTVLACTVMMDELFCLKKPEINVVLVGVLTVVFLFQFGFGVLDILNAYRAEGEREQKIYEAIQRGETTVTLTNHYNATRYALPFILDVPDNWINMTVASYYGLDSVYGLDPSNS